MQDGERHVFRLMGMDDGPNPEPGWAERIDNLAIDAQGTWHNCTDWVGLYDECAGSSSPSQSTSRYQSIFWWAQRGTGRQWIVWSRATTATSASLEVFDGVNQTYQTLASGRQRIETPNPGDTYIPINGWLYIINGYDQPVRWNGRWPTYGSQLTQVGFTQAPPPPSARVGAPDNNVSGAAASGIGVASALFRYGYAITYVNNVGAESPASEIVYITDTNGAGATLYHGKLTIAAPPAHVQAIRIYRTVNLSTAPATSEGARFSLYHVIDLPSGCAQAWDDGLPDQLLGHELDTTQLGLFPVGARYAALFKGTLFLAGAPSYPDRVFYSAPALVEQFPAGNTFDFATGAGGEITGLHATQNALIVFRRRGVYLVKGDPVNGFYAETVSEDTGCIAPGAIVDVPTQQAVMFFSQEGPYLLKGAMQEGVSAETQLIPVMDKIRRLWQVEVDTGGMLGARAAIYKRDQEIMFALPGRSDPSTQVWLVYHYLHGFWSRRDYVKRANSDAGTHRITAMCAVDDHRGLVLACRQNHAVGEAIDVTGKRLINGFPAGGAITDATLVWRYRLGVMGTKFAHMTVQKVEVLGLLASKAPAAATNKTTAAGTIQQSGGGIALRVRTDRRVMEDIAFTVDWSAQDWTEMRPPVGKTQMIESEYAVDAWNTSLWDTGTWQRPTHRVYPMSVTASGTEVQFEICGGGYYVQGCELRAIAMFVVGGPMQSKWDQGLGSARG